MQDAAERIEQKDLALVPVAVSNFATLFSHSHQTASRKPAIPNGYAGLSKSDIVGIAVRFARDSFGGLGGMGGAKMYGEIKEATAALVVWRRIPLLAAPYTLSACWHKVELCGQFRHLKSRRLELALRHCWLNRANARSRPSAASAARFESLCDRPEAALRPNSRGRAIHS
jgi:hypothetical protein